jgi:exosortase
MIAQNESNESASRPHYMAAAIALLCACSVWSYWSVLGEMAHRWSVDPTYSHGYIVPLLAVAILWARRHGRPKGAIQPDWWGVAVIALGAIMQSAGAFYYVRWLSGAAILADIAGIVLLLGGRPTLRWAAPSILFLIFMVPLPYRVDVILRQPLQRISTISSGFALQTLGLPAIVEGNIIVLDDVELGVVDACSGLKMFIVFFCLSTAVAILIRRPLAERFFIVLLACPIAIACNVVRITTTGVMHEVAGKRWADLVFHDLAGWMMMPLALGMLWCGVKVLSLLFVEVETARGSFRPMVSSGGPSQQADVLRKPPMKRPSSGSRLIRLMGETEHA